MEMRLRDNGIGYLAVTLCVEKHPRHLYVHRLVWESINGEIPPGFEINHRDGNKKNNCISNLELVTRYQNMQHAIDTGLLKTPRPCKLSAQNVIEIRTAHMGGESQSALARRFGVDVKTVHYIVHRITWKHIA